MSGRDELDRQVDALEMDMLNEDGNEKKRDLKDILAKYPMYARYWFDKLVTLLRLYYRAYPKAVLVTGAVLSFLLVKVLFFRHRGKTVYVLPHLVNHFGDVQSYYDLTIGKIDHWCLQGGDNGCWCEDPTVPESKEEISRWVDLHEKNKVQARNPPPNLDVVFLGDQFVQAWTGEFFRGPIFGGIEIQSAFNRTFHRAEGGLVDGIAMGIDGDTTSNLLWRIQNGEMPESLNPKDEIKVQHPESVVVIQGILPRSSYADGHVRTIKNSTHLSKTLFHHSEKEYVKVEEYPLWPSIQLINAEVAKFCAKHEHLLFFDASDIFFGSLGNSYYVASEKVLIKELYKSDHVTPSKKGFEILAKVIGKEVVRIVYNHDESNHKVTPDEERRTQ